MTQKFIQNNMKLKDGDKFHGYIMNQDVNQCYCYFAKD